MRGGSCRDRSTQPGEDLGCRSGVRATLGAAAIRPVVTGRRVGEPQGPGADVHQRAARELVESPCPGWGQHTALGGQGGCWAEVPGPLPSPGWVRVERAPGERSVPPLVPCCPSENITSPNRNWGVCSPCHPLPGEPGPAWYLSPSVASEAGLCHGPHSSSIMHEGDPAVSEGALRGWGSGH